MQCRNDGGDYHLAALSTVLATTELAQKTIVLSKIDRDDDGVEERFLWDVRKSSERERGME